MVAHPAQQPCYPRCPKVEGAQRLSPQEALALTEGGPLVAREAATRRIDLACLTIAQHMHARRSAPQPTSAPRVTDPVLVVAGRAGSGCTRLAREALFLARKHGLPVILIAGKDGPPLTADPLGLAFRALSALASPTDSSLLTPHSPHEREGGDRRGLADRADRAYTKQRLIETFVTRALAASIAQPFALLVEDYSDLPDLVQQAVCALSRDLLDQSDYGPTTDVPPILLVVDARTDHVQSLLPLDRPPAKQPVIEVRPLAGHELPLFADAHFPGLVLDPPLVSRLLQMTGGLPAALCPVLAELHPDNLGRVIHGLP